MKVSETFKGTSDISGEDLRKRLAVIDIIREVFESFGFEPLETPILERKDVLTGNYGEEAEKLIFILGKPYDNGGLRYDHTVPLARYAAKNWQSLPTPYKRYAMGPVFRGENPQAGRYRQFYQCDFDTLGTESLLADAEIPAMNYEIFSRLGFSGNFEIQFNDRRFLNAITSDEKIMRAWDKLDKVNVDELDFGDLEEDTRFLLSTNSISDIRDHFKSDKISSALDKIEELLDLAKEFGVPDDVIQFNPLLARGLSYYTGPIFETIVTEAGIGSISGGGRYDKLIESLGGPDVPATGSSFGIDRIMDVMKELGIEPDVKSPERILMTVFDQQHLPYSIKAADSLRRDDGMSVTLYPSINVSISKQISYANKKGFDKIAIAGPKEADEGVISIKILQTGKQEKKSI